MLRALLFDLDNTLIDRDRAFHAYMCEQFQEPTVHAELYQLDKRGYGSRDALFAAWHRHGGGMINHETLGSAIADRICPDVYLLTALSTLAFEFKLGIVSNGNSVGQRQKWRAAGLADVIPHERVLISAEVGIKKPDPRIFLMACRLLNEAPGNCLFLGDHPQNDVAGAAAAGLRARLVCQVLDAERLRAILQEEAVR